MVWPGTPFTEATDRVTEEGRLAPGILAMKASAMPCWAAAGASAARRANRIRKYKILCGAA